MVSIRDIAISACFVSLIYAVVDAAPRETRSREILRMKAPIDNHQLNYLLLEPSDDDFTKPRPLLIFLHGAGERGGDMTQALRHGPVKHREQFESLRQSYLLVPQCPTGSWWRTKALMSLIMEVLEKPALRIDRSQIYLTGLSMGGYASWKLLSEYPDFFAAVVPVCGGGDFSSLNITLDIDRVPSFSSKDLRNATRTPVWAFHGALDQAVPVQQSIELTELLTKNGNQTVKLTVYSDIGHNAWDPTYSDPKMYEWLYRQRRKR